MNVVLLSDKKHRKSFEAAVKKDPNINLVGVEMVLRGNTMSRIADHHNPHVLVVYKGVPEKEGITENSCIAFLRMVKPNMRIIYVYGNVEDIEAFTTTTDQLLSNGITDIITDTAADEVVKVIDEPMTEEDVQELIENLTAPEEKIIHEEVLHEDVLPVQEYEPLDVDFPTVTASDKFNIDKIVYEVSETKNSEHLTIGIAQLQHHNGCTHTAFELATMISKNNTVAVIMADPDTFEALAVFHKINPLKAQNGLIVHNIAVFPYEMCSQIANDYSVIIYDYSYLREEKRKSFDECDIKLMLSSAAEWDVAKTLNFIKYNDESYIRNIHFLFPRVSQSKFLKYSKLFKKSGINAYRLLDSPDWLTPVEGNIAVYTHIVENYNITKSDKQRKRKFLKIK